MVELLILADDFTGALDTAAQFSGRGIPTQVYSEDRKIDFDSLDPSLKVLSINMETRHMNAEAAYRHTKRITEGAVAAGISRVYKKTDSALRGNVGSELQAVLDGSGGNRLFFLPAYPNLGRTTEKGIQYLDGIKIEDTVFGEDPFEPVLHSEVKKIIGLQSKVVCRTLEQRGPLPEENREQVVYTVDAVSNEDIIDFCKKMPRDGLQLMAGCAGFAEFLAAEMESGSQQASHISKIKNIIIASGSLNPISRRQMRYIAGKGVLLIRVEPEHLTGPKERREGILAEAAESLRKCGIVAIETAGETIGKDADRRAMEEERQQIGKDLGYLVKEIAGLRQDYALMIIGGDTLRNIIREMFKSVIIPLKPLNAGTVLSQAESSEGRPVIIATKSGGFGEENTLERICHYLKEHCEEVQ